MNALWKRRLRNIGLVLAAATLLGLAESTQVHMGTAAAGRPLSWSRSFSSCMPSWYVLAALIPFVLAVARRYPLDTLNRPRTIIVHIGAGITFAWVHLLISGWLSDYVLFDMARNISFMDNHWRIVATYFVTEMLQYAGLVGIYFAYEYSRRYREKERAASALALKASRLETSLSRANLEALRMQLNPHFLFNTLNTVSVLALKGEKQRVTRMLSQLSDLLRLSLENDRQTLSLKEELEFLRRYLEIEQVRFGERFTVSIHVDDAANDAEVPSLVLQPIVENAVKYGFAQTVGPCNVSIECRVKSSMLELQVTDTGPGFPESRAPLGLGVGLANTRARLEQLFGSNYSLELGNRPEGGALVRVRIPYIRFSNRSHDTRSLLAWQA
jgi:sensor histidine kinase YesM